MNLKLNKKGENNMIITFLIKTLFEIVIRILLFWCFLAISKCVVTILFCKFVTYSDDQIRKEINLREDVNYD